MGQEPSSRTGSLDARSLSPPGLPSPGDLAPERPRCMELALFNPAMGLVGGVRNLNSLDGGGLGTGRRWHEVPANRGFSTAAGDGVIDRLWVKLLL